MAGTGRTPKQPEERRNHEAPQRGEWKEVRADSNSKVPPLPRRGEGRGTWSERTRRAWRAWWRDPVSKMWKEADRDLAEHLADVFEEWVREPKGALAAETRQLRDNLGLSPKGRQDRRWRIVEADVHSLAAEREQRRPSEPAASTRGRVRAIDPQA